MPQTDSDLYHHVTSGLYSDNMNVDMPRDILVVTSLG